MRDVSCGARAGCEGRGAVACEARSGCGAHGATTWRQELATRQPRRGANRLRGSHVGARTIYEEHEAAACVARSGYKAHEAAACGERAVCGAGLPCQWLPPWFVIGPFILFVRLWGRLELKSLSISSCGLVEMRSKRWVRWIGPLIIGRRGSSRIDDLACFLDSRVVRTRKCDSFAPSNPYQRDLRSNRSRSIGGSPKVRDLIKLQVSAILESSEVEPAIPLFLLICINLRNCYIPFFALFHL